MLSYYCTDSEVQLLSFASSTGVCTLRCVPQDIPITERNSCFCALFNLVNFLTPAVRSYKHLKMAVIGVKYPTAPAFYHPALRTAFGYGIHAMAIGTAALEELVGVCCSEGSHIPGGATASP